MKTYKVLAVDDEPFNLDLIELAFLEEQNIKLIQARNGKEAIDKLNNSNDIDVILLDIRTPIYRWQRNIKNH